MKGVPTQSLRHKYKPHATDNLSADLSTVTIRGRNDINSIVKMKNL